MAEPEYEPMQQRSLFHEQGQVGRGADEDPDRRAEEGQRRLQVLAAVADYLGKRKRRRR